MFETVIFDWDGTLADTRAAILYAFHKALNEIGADVSDKQIERRIGIGSSETFRQILRSRKKSFDEALIRKLLEKKIQFEIDMGGQIRLFPGAMELLEYLQGKVKLGLASMNNRQVIDHLLKTTETQGLFVATVTADEISRPKPDPEIFLKTANKLQTAPERCAVVEDSVFGVEAAKAANMGCVAVAQSAYSRDELSLANPDLVVSSLREKAAILKFILV